MLIARNVFWKLGFPRGRLQQEMLFLVVGLFCRHCCLSFACKKRGLTEKCIFARLNLMEKCSNLRSVLTEKYIFARRNLIEKCKNNVVQKDKDVYRAAFEVRWGQDSSYRGGKTDWQVFLLDNLMAVADYHIASAVVLSNDREIKTVGNVLYLPIYHVMFLENRIPEKEDLFF